MNFPKFWARARAGSFATWRWSNSSIEDAQNSARQAAERLAAQFAQQGRPLDRYGYADRPLREPVLQEIRNSGGELSAVVTRNSYGCQVLNTARGMFVDIDFPPVSPAAGKIVGLFASLFGGAPADPVKTAIAKAEAWASSRSGWNWRIYRTPAGLRLLATHALQFDPADRGPSNCFRCHGRRSSVPEAVPDAGMFPRQADTQAMALRRRSSAEPLAVSRPFRGTRVRRLGSGVSFRQPNEGVLQAAERGQWTCPSGVAASGDAAR